MAIRLLKILSTLVFTIFIIIVTVLLSTISFVFLPYRWLVQMIARVFRPDLVSIVRGSSNVMFSVNTGTLSTANISAFLILAGAQYLTEDEVRNRVQKFVLDEVTPEGVHVYAKLKQVLTPFMGYRFFSPVKSFNLAEHVRYYDYTGELALPMNRYLTETDLKILCGKIASKPWIVGRSNWEILIVKDFRSDDSDEMKSILLFRINHAYADGFSVSRIFSKISDLAREPPKFTSTGTLRQSTLQAAMLPFKIIWDGALEIAKLQADRSKWTLGWYHNQPREPMSTFTRQYPIQKIKEIKNKFKVDYTTILLSALSAGIYKMMSRAGAEIPKRLLCVFPIPKPNHPYGMTNHMLGGILLLPIFDRTTKSNINLMGKHFQSAMQSKAPLLTDLWLNMLSVLPISLAKISYLMVSPQMAISVMPVITRPSTYGGGQLHDVISLVVGVNFPARQGAVVATSGANGLQRISVVLDQSVFPHPETFSYLGQYVEKELDIMYERIVGEESSV